MEKVSNTKNEYKSGEDIRYILLEDSPFVPAYSLPYSWDETSNDLLFLPSISGG